MTWVDPQKPADLDGGMKPATKSQTNDFKARFLGQKSKIKYIKFDMDHCCEKKTSALLQLRVKQGRVLKIVMAINFIMFGAEFSSGLIANSTALMADSLDMLGDGIVYAFSLYVLHRSVKWRASAALLKGVIIVFFGLGVLIEAISKISSTGLPISEMMGIFGFLALVANISCLTLLYRHRDDDINMKSTWICSRNDIISNVGVLIAAALVWSLQSKWPDVIVGFIIAILFLRSAWPILVEALRELRNARPVASAAGN